MDRLCSRNDGVQGSRNPGRTVRHGRLWIAAMSAVLAAACSDTTTGVVVTTHSSKNIHFIAGYDVTDTAGTTPIQGLVVEVTDDSGAILPGTVIRFTGTIPDPSRPFLPSMLVAPAASLYFNGTAFDTTNSRGRATILVQLGTIAGPGRIVATVPELGVQDTAQYTILPGQPAGVRMTPKDTALYAGGQLQLRGAVVDRNGNPRTDPVTYTAAAAGVSVDASGAVTAGGSPARASVIVGAQTHADTGWISVVPHGTIAAYQSQDTTGVVIVNLDGSGFQRLAPAVSGNTDVTPVWSADGTQIVYATGAYGTPMHLEAVSLQGVVRQFLQSPPTSLAEATWPQYSHDGNVVYFSGHDATSNFALWRASSGGSGATQIGRNVGCCSVDWRSSPSADGLRLAYVTDGTILQVLTMSSGAVSSTGVNGQSPRWSPTADVIAFTTQYGGPLKLMNPDGSNVHQISAGGRSYSESGFGWSPDGRWIVARGSASLELLDTQTGLTLPLGFTGKLNTPSWKP